MGSQLGKTLLPLLRELGAALQPEATREGGCHRLLMRGLEGEECKEGLSWTPKMEEEGERWGGGVQRPYCEAELPFFCLTVLQPLPGEDQGDEDSHFPVPTLASLVPVLGWVQGGLQTPMS